MGKRFVVKARGRTNPQIPCFWGPLTVAGAVAAAVEGKCGSWVPAGALLFPQQQWVSQHLHFWAQAVTGKGVVDTVDIYASVMNFPDTKSHSRTISLPQ